LSPRETRVVALGAPSDKERNSWYFQRYAPHLPAAQEMVVFNRSWYNRAGRQALRTSEHHSRSALARFMSRCRQAPRGAGSQDCVSV
jgi:polyphosphate kinase 2 (PPK2 family)